MMWIVPLIVVVVLAAAYRYGTDSRDGRDWSSVPQEPRCLPRGPRSAGRTSRGDAVTVAAGLMRAVAGSAGAAAHASSPLGEADPVGTPRRRAATSGSRRARRHADPLPGCC